MTEGERKLHDQMRSKGWDGVRIVPPESRQYDQGIEAMGTDPAGDISIHVDAGDDGHCEGFAVHRKRSNDSLDSSGRIRHSKGVPTPEEAVGIWENLEADTLRGLVPVEGTKWSRT